MNNKGSQKGASDMITELRSHFQTLESKVNFLREELKEKSVLLKSLIIDKQNANSCPKLPTTPEKSMVLSPITKKQTLTTNKKIDFHTDNGLKNKHISEVNKVKKVFFTTDINQINDNKTEKQTVYTNSNSSHATTKSKDNNSNNNNNNTNSSNNSHNIQDTITPNTSPNPSENDPSDQSTGEQKKGTTLIVEDSMISGLREAKLSRNRKVKVRFLLGVKTEDLMFHLIPWLNKKPDNIILHIGTSDGPYSNENAIYVEIKKIKELIRTHYPDCQLQIIETFLSPPLSYIWIIKKLPTY